MAARVCEYTKPTFPSGSDVVAMVSSGKMVIDKAFVPVAPTLSLIWKVMVVGPLAEVGVPEIVAPLRDKPAGSAPDVMAHV